LTDSPPFIKQVVENDLDFGAQRVVLCDHFLIAGQGERNA
jgi:hypothetical protein